MSGEETTPLLGRANELSALTHALDGVGTHGQPLLLTGEPGIGKSRLLVATAQAARERGMTVLRAAGVQTETHLPFAGLHQLLRPVRGRAAGLPSFQQEALNAAFGVTADRPPEQFQIAMAVLDLCSDIATDAPLLLVIDDAQWLDRPSLEIVAFISRRIESDPIVLLVAIREGYPSLLQEAGIPELKLTGLVDSMAEALVDAAAPHLSKEARHRVLRQAAGNPLALLELPAVTGQIDGEESSDDDLPLTERLERAFAARVSDLPEMTRLVLLVAALDDEPRVDEILQAADLLAGAGIGRDALIPAVDARMVDLDLRTLHFRHPLIRSAIVQRASVARCTTRWRTSWRTSSTDAPGTARLCCLMCMNRLPSSSRTPRCAPSSAGLSPSPSPRCEGRQSSATS